MRLPPQIQPPAASLLNCLPSDLPAPLRKKLDAALATWREAVVARDAAVAELGRLSDPAALPPDLTGERILEARDHAERQAAAAVLDYAQAARRLALLFRDVLPFAEKHAQAAAEATQAARTAVARKLRGVDLLLSDKDLQEAMRHSPEIAAADESEQHAGAHLAACRRHAGGPALQQADTWIRRVLFTTEAPAAE